MKRFFIIPFSRRKTARSVRNVLGLVLVFLLGLSMLSGCLFIKDMYAVTPLMWKVTAPDGQIMYLFGSMHVADKKLYPLPAGITNAFKSCDYLAVEADIVAFENDEEAMMVFIQSFMYPEGQTIADEISAELYQRARARLAELQYEWDISLEVMDNFRPAMWADLLQSVATQRAGLSGDYGLDRYFLTEAKKNGMGILEVESVAEQIDMMLGFSLPLQALMLEESLSIDQNVFAQKLLYSLWKRGNAELIEIMSIPGEEALMDELFAEYWDAMSVKRNLLMAETAMRYMDEGKTVFFVVGLMHMLGDGGIVALLRQSGYTVERVLR